MLRSDGYSPLSIVLHWLAAIFVVALFLTHDGERGSSAYVIHVSGGAIIGVFLLWRVWQRVRRGMIDSPDQALLLNAAARGVQWGFLAAIVVAVLTGYLLQSVQQFKIIEQHIEEVQWGFLAAIVVAVLTGYLLQSVQQFKIIEQHIEEVLLGISTRWREPRHAQGGPVFLRRRQIMARPEGLPRRFLRSLQARSQDVRRARNRARRRTLPPPVPCSHQGQSPHPRRLGTRPPQRQSATRPHGNRRGPIPKRRHPDHQPTARRQMARCHRRTYFADAILDRIVHNVHRINLDGPSMRKTIAENFNANDVDHAER